MSKKLVIKVNNLGTLDEDALARKYEVEQYLWGRIIVASALVFLLIASSIWWFVKPEQTESEVATVMDTSSAVEPVKVAETPAVVEPSVVELSVVEPSVVEPGAATVVETAVVKVVPQIVAKAEVNVEAETEVEPTIAELKAQPMTAAGALESDTETVKTAHNPASDTQITFLTPGIVRAQLTHLLDNEKKPTDVLGSNIRMSDEGLIRVYLYTEIEGLAGKTLYHSWSLNGERMARVRIPVVSNSYRASSSKFIDRMMLGEWQVVIADEGGNRYVEVAFTVSK